MKQVVLLAVLVLLAESSQSSMLDDKIFSLQLQLAKLQAEKAAINQSSVGSTGDSRRGRSGIPSIPSSVTQALAGAGGYPAIVFENGRDAIHAPQRLAYIPRLFSEDECAYLMQKAQPNFEASLVMGSMKGKGDRLEEVTRSSQTAYFDDEREDQTLRRLIQRMHSTATIPVQFGEDLQVTLYPPGSNYTLHFDSSPGVGRLVTVLVFLKDVEKGGHTVFPKSRVTTVGRRKLDLIAAGKYEALLRSDGTASSVEELDEAERWWDETLGNSAARRPAQLEAEKDWKWRWAHRQGKRAQAEKNKNERKQRGIGEAASDSGVTSDDPATAPPSELGNAPLPEPKLPTLGNRPSAATQADMGPFCASRRVLSFAPRRGDALVWYSHKMQLEMDFNTMHGGCPPLEDEEKFIAQRWMRWYLPEDGNSMYRLLKECGVLRPDQ